MAKKTLAAKVEELGEKVRVLQHLVEGYMRENTPLNPKKPKKGKRDVDFDDDWAQLLDLDDEPAKTKKRDKSPRVLTVGTVIGVYEICVGEKNALYPDAFGNDPELPKGADWDLPYRCELIAISDALEDEDVVHRTDFPKGVCWTADVGKGCRWVVDVREGFSVKKKGFEKANILWIRRI